METLTLAGLLLALAAQHKKKGAAHLNHVWLIETIAALEAVRLRLPDINVLLG
jgi:hypothetical protein